MRLVGARAVVIDDSPVIRKLVVRVLRSEGADVVGEAKNGQRGISIVSDLQPDLVILDVDMPVMTGTEALPLIRAAAPRACIAIFTGAPGQVIDAQQYALGIYAKEDLMRLISDFCAWAERRLEPNCP